MKPLRAIQSIILLCLAISTLPLRANPLSPSQWYRINTPHVNLIFRGIINEEAQRLANTFDHLYNPVSRSLNVRPPVVSITLWDRRFISNALVGSAPMRMELYNGPSQNCNFIGTNDWFNLLAVHEFRHVAQYAKLNQNFNRVLYWLGGEMALGSIIGTLVPSWFLEGDAVGIETALTKSGRGRIPAFSALYKANLLERGISPYCKQVFGSFKHQLPNAYPVGYYLTTYLRRKYGANVVDDILEKTTWPMFFLLAVKKVTGKSLFQICQDTNEELENLWKKQLEGLKLTPATSIIARRDATYTDYKYPQLDEEGNIVVLKSGLGTVAQFVLIDKQGKEYPIFIPGTIDQKVSFSLKQGQIVWAESVPHPRWEDRYYGVIQKYDTLRKRTKILSHRSRYGAAALSPDATKIIAVESDVRNQHRLVVLDATDGKTLHHLPNPDNHFYLTPRWLANGRLVVAVKHTQQRATLTLVDTLTGESQDLLPYSEENIATPVPHGKYIFYNSAYNGIDNIYALDSGSRQRYQVTSRKYGAYNPTVSDDGRWIIFNDFTKDGMDVVKMPFAPQEWIPLEKVEDRSIRYHAPLVTQEDNEDVLEQIPNKAYPVEPYHPGAHWLNIHSWPWPIPQEGTKGQLGGIISSNDLLKRTQLQVGYLHSNHIGKTFIDLKYNGWYPVTGLEGSLKKDYKKGTTEKAVALTFALPLRSIDGQYIKKFLLSTTSGLDIDSQLGSFTQNCEIRISRETKKSPRDFYPPWKQQLILSHTYRYYYGDNSIGAIGAYSEDKIQQVLLEVEALFSFPGFSQHHSFLLSPKYTNLGFINFPYLENSETYQMGLDYKWPIAYPDWSLGNLFYIKRLIGHVSYGPRFIPNAKMKYQYKVGIGAKIEVGLSFLNIPLEIGGIIMYDNKSHFDFLPSLRPIQ